MKKRRSMWLAAAVALLALAGWLMSASDTPAPEPEAKSVAMPRRMTGAEHTRMEKRLTLPPLKVAEAEDAEPKPAAPPKFRDPVLTALPGGGASVLVLEANAVRNSPIGELLLDCLRNGPHDTLEVMKKEAGIDLAKDIDRVAVSERVLMVSGQFAQARWSRLMQDRRTTTYGDATVFGALGTDPEHQDYAAVWRDQLFLLGESQADVEAAVDRLEGRAPSTPTLTEQDTYGEMYGVLTADDMAAMLPPEEREMADKLRKVAQKVALHVDASGDVGIVADVLGDPSPDLEDLGKSFGGALSLARLQAQAQGNATAAELLEQARVVPRDGKFTLEVALPLPLLEKHLAFCRNRQPAQKVQP